MKQAKLWATTVFAFFAVIFICGFFQGERNNYLRLVDIVNRLDTPYPILINECRSIAARTSDPDLKFVAEYHYKFAEMFSSTGYQSHQDAISKGKLDHFVRGLAIPFINPAAGWDMLFKGAGLWMDESRFKECGERVMNRYDHRPIWIYVVALCAAYFVHLQVEYSTRSSVSAVPNTAPVTTTESLTVCPKCGAKNRNKVLAAGQKLVCGQCKTVLHSVS